MTAIELIATVHTKVIQMIGSGDTQLLYPKINIIIADDSDWHRTKRGYFTYDSVTPVTHNERRWLMTKSVKTGAYPGDFLKGDLAFIPLPGTVEEGITTFRNVRDLSNTLLVGLESGRLVQVPGEPFSSKFFQKYTEELANMAAQQPIMDQDHISLSTLKPLISQEARYSSSAADILVEKILDYLA